MLIRHTVPIRGQRHPPTAVLPHPKVFRCRSASLICISVKDLELTTGKMDFARKVSILSLKQKVLGAIPGGA